MRRILAPLSWLAGPVVAAWLSAGCLATPVAEPGDLDQAGELGDDDLQPIDVDRDGIPNAEDNCPATDNPGQEDADMDGVGDVCDDCPGVSDPEQEDADENNVGDACEGMAPPPSETPPPSNNPPPPPVPEEDPPLCDNGDDLCRAGE
jgi:hypothetical protein